jgi:hypothetical protein
MSASSFREVIALWDSPAALAGEIGVGIAAARKWSFRNNIPAEYWFLILRTETAREAGLTAELLAAIAADLVEART